jgi:hypothetical protein
LHRYRVISYDVTDLWSSMVGSLSNGFFRLSARPNVFEQVQYITFISSTWHLHPVTSTSESMKLREAGHKKYWNFLIQHCDYENSFFNVYFQLSLSFFTFQNAAKHETYIWQWFLSRCYALLITKSIASFTQHMSFMNITCCCSLTLLLQFCTWLWQHTRLIGKLNI